MKKRKTCKILVAIVGIMISVTNLSAVIYFNGAGGVFDEQNAYRKTVYEIENSKSIRLIHASWSSTKEYQQINSVKTKAISTYITEGAGNFLESYSDFMRFLSKVERADIEGMDYGELSQILNDAIKKMEKAKEKYIELKQIAAVTPYKQTVINELLNIAYKIERHIDAQKRPEFSDLWELNESCSKSLLFGQYAARVFFDINKRKLL
jgi:hypothetical protein